MCYPLNMSPNLIQRDEAEAILLQNGWLFHQPEAFQKEVLRRSILVHFAPGERIFGFGDEPAGIYGLVSGAVMINTAPPNHIPQLINVGAPGAWHPPVTGTSTSFEGGPTTPLVTPRTRT